MFRGIKIALAFLLLFSFGCTGSTISTKSLAVPNLSLSQMPAALPADTDVKINYKSVQDGNKTINSVTLEYSLDGGVSWVRDANASATGPDSFCNWHTPATDYSTVKIRITTKDNRGLSSATQVSNLFQILTNHLKLTVDNSTVVANFQSAPTSNTNSATFTGTCVPGYSLHFYGGIVPQLPSAVASNYTNDENANASISCQTSAGSAIGGIWSLTVTDPSHVNYNFSYYVQASDIAGNTALVGFIWERTALGPVITANTLAINQSTGSFPVTTYRSYNKMSATVTDLYSPITAVCTKRYPGNLVKVASNGSLVLKSGTAVPAPAKANDTNFNCSSITAQTGSAPFSYNYTGNVSAGVIPGVVQNEFIWFFNAAGNISQPPSGQLAATVGFDVASINYLPANPPLFNSILVTNTATPHLPPLPSEMVISSGSNAYIQWNIADNNGGNTLPPGSIGLSFTQDEVRYSTIVGGLSNVSNGCVLSSGFTGCYIWTPTLLNKNYLKVRVSATNSMGLLGYGSSAALNMGKNTGFGLNWLAGNTDLGVGGSAGAAIFEPIQNGGQYHDGHSFVVASDGTLYYRHAALGIVKVDPDTGVVSTYVPINSTAGAGSGSTASTVASLTLPNPFSASVWLSIDSSDHLLVWVSDRILSINTATGAVSTLIGGGASTSTTGPITATSLLISGAASLMQPLPNGDLVFQSNNDSGSSMPISVTSATQTPVLRYFHATADTSANHAWAAGQVTSMKINFGSGAGAMISAGSTFNQPSPTQGTVAEYYSGYNVASTYGISANRIASFAYRFGASLGSTYSGSNTASITAFLNALQTGGQGHSVAMSFGVNPMALVSGYSVATNNGTASNLITTAFSGGSGTYDPGTGSATILPNVSFPVGNEGVITGYSSTTGFGYSLDDYLDFGFFNAPNGDLYSISRWDSALEKYSPATNLWSIILGGNGPGSCVDGTLATSCNVMLQDAFVTAAGQIYFVDAGVIRAIDDNGKVITVFGQSKTFGDQQPALTARFDSISWLDLTTTSVSNGIGGTISNIIVPDSPENQIRLIDYAGTCGGAGNKANYSKCTPGNMVTLAGNSNSVTGTILNGASANTSMPMLISNQQDIVAITNIPGTQDFLMGISGLLYKYVSNTGLWSQLSATPNTSGNYFSNDGVAVSAVIYDYTPSIFGINANGFLVADHHWTGSVYTDSRYNRVSSSDNFTSNFINNLYLGEASTADDSSTSASFHYCADGTSLSSSNSCNVPEEYGVTRSTYDSSNHEWMILDAYYYPTTVKVFPDTITGGSVSSITLNNAAKSFVYVPWSSIPSKGAIYYCAKSDGMIHMVPDSSKPSVNDVALSWPTNLIGTTQVSCTGKSISYVPSVPGVLPSALIFPITQNGLGGVIEYIGPKEECISKNGPITQANGGYVCPQ